MIIRYLTLSSNTVIPTKIKKDVVRRPFLFLIDINFNAKVLTIEENL